MDNALVGVYKSNLAGDILFVNKALAEFFEFESPEDMMKKLRSLSEKDVLPVILMIHRLVITTCSRYP